MSEDLNLDEVMTRRFELDEQITATQMQQKAAIAPLVEEMQMCEQYIKTELLKSGAQQWKSSSTGHMTYWMSKDSVTVKDMDAVIHFMLAAAPPIPDLEMATKGKTDAEVWALVIDHIQNEGMWSLLNKAVNKTAAKELIEAQQQPPGIEYTSFKDLAWRRGKT